MATTGAINSGDICDLTTLSVERRSGPANRLPVPIEWLSDGGSPHTAREPRAFATETAWCCARRPSKARNRTAWPKRL